MADKYERLLMKERIKEARHQAKLNELRRKKELSEIRERNVQSVVHIIMAVIALVPVLLIVGFCVSMLIK